MCPVPPLAASAAKAKSAIHMQMLCEELSHTAWGRDAWSLHDVSEEAFRAPPQNSFKKGSRIVEVTYDGDPNNKNWYTAWNLLFLRTESGWTFATGGADGKGLYYTMNGSRTHYLLFEQDAARFSASGFWQVADQENIYNCVSSTSDYSSDTVDGAASEASQHHSESACTGETPRASQPDPFVGGSAGGGPIRASSGRIRGSTGSNPYPVPLCQGIPLCTPPSSPVPCSLSVGLERESEVTAAPPSPDSSQHQPPPVARETTESGAGYTIFPPERKTYCLLLSGGANCVKCLRFRFKRYHRFRFDSITTTWWAAGDEGHERKGEATILLTFSSWDQRKLFLDLVSIPPGITERLIAVSAD